MQLYNATILHNYIVQPYCATILHNSPQLTCTGLRRVPAGEQHTGQQVAEDVPAWARATSGTGKDGGTAGQATHAPGKENPKVDLQYVGACWEHPGSVAR